MTLRLEFENGHCKTSIKLYVPDVTAIVGVVLIGHVLSVDGAVVAREDPRVGLGEAEAFAARIGNRLGRGQSDNQSDLQMMTQRKK